MITTTRAHAAGDHRHRLTSLLGGALATLLALWTMCCTVPPRSFAAPNFAMSSTRSPCSKLRPGSTECTNALAIAGASNSEGEEGEGLEEGEGGEAVASTEAEAEEAGSEAVSPLSDHASHHSVVLSQLRLTAKATAALKRTHPSASVVGFSFTLSARAKVHMTLLKQTSVNGHKQWTMLPDSLTITVGKGRASQSLVGHNTLSPGRYRLTAKPTAGRPRSIYLSARQ
jgi:hypothetical protein